MKEGSPRRAAKPNNDTSPAIEILLESWRERMERGLAERLPRADVVPTRLHEAMRYSVLGGGKRIRSALIFATALTVGLTEDEVEAAACAIELVHAYSLVHDDLPAMDDDDLRRGRPTCHKAYDEATAILVGDALQPLAFQLLARDPSLPAAPAIRLRLIELLAEARSTGVTVSTATVGWSKSKTSRALAKGRRSRKMFDSSNFCEGKIKGAPHALQ